MSNKKENGTEKIVTAAEIATMNNRADDSLSFVSGGLLEAKPDKGNKHKVGMVATKDGNIWLIPANGGSPINLTQTYLSEEQFANIASIPEMMKRLNQYLDIIKEYSEGGINKQLSKRITELEDSLTNLLTTSVRTTDANQNLNASGNGISNEKGTQLSDVLKNIVSHIVNIRKTPSVSPITITAISDEFVVPQNNTPRDFLSVDYPGYKRIQRVRHMRMTIGAPTENSTPMIDNTNSVNHFYTAENRPVESNAWGINWQAYGRMTLSEDGESHNIQVRRFAGINYSVAVPNRSATIRATDLLMPTYKDGYTAEYYQEIESIVNKYELNLKEVDDVQKLQDDKYCEELFNNSTCKEYDNIVLWFDNYFEKELKAKSWQDDYTPSYDELNKKSYGTWEELQKIANEMQVRMKELQSDFDNLMTKLLNYHNESVKGYTTKCKELQKKRNKEMQACIKKYNKSDSK